MEKIKHRRLRVFDQVECITEMDPQARLFFQKGEHYFLCEVMDPQPPQIRILNALMGVVMGARSIPLSASGKEKDYGIRILGVEYPFATYSRASDFKLIGLLCNEPEDRVESLRKSLQSEGFDEQDEDPDEE